MNRLILSIWGLRTFVKVVALGVALGWCGAVQAQSNYYVSLSGANISPYTNWATAATQLQLAVDAAVVGATVWVTNGVYQAGLKVASGSTLSNRVSITKAITVRSVNGPAVTSIKGGGAYNVSPIRCVHMSAGSLIGFTLTNGFTYAAAALVNGGGGGLYGGSGVIVSNCVFSGNTAFDGGGACNANLYDCTLVNNRVYDLGGGVAAQFGTGYVARNCIISNNVSLTFGGGAVGASLYNCRVQNNLAMTGGGGLYRSSGQNCLIAGNWAEEGGGVHSGNIDDCTVVNNTASFRAGGCTVSNAVNCLIYFNHAQEAIYDNFAVAPNYLNVCTWPMPPSGSGNITNDPMIVSVDNPRLLPGSPCYNAGYNYAWMTNDFDIEGNPRITTNTVDIGAYEWAGTASLTGSLTAAIGVVYTQVVVGASLDLEAQSSGKVQQMIWDFGDGASMTNSCEVSHVWGSAGTYDVMLKASNLSGSVMATSKVVVVTSSNFYVKTSGSDAAAGTNWATAKLTIQAAVNVAPVGGTVWVTNGTYSSGGQSAGGQQLMNRVAVTKPITVRSVGGPTVTIISGGGAYDVSNAVRCVYLAEGATLAGFALTNGVTFGDPTYAADGTALTRWGGNNGGGLYAQSIDAVVTNCRIGASSAYRGGGGYGGTYYQCDVNYNFAPDNAGLGGGVYYGQMFDSTLLGNHSEAYGGGAYWGQYSNCTFTSNSALYGGGVATGELVSCSLIGNTATNQGGGAWNSQLESCSLVSNRQTSIAVATYGGGGAYGGTAYGCDVACNYAAVSGGGFYSVRGSNGTLRLNVADSMGGGVYNPTAGYAITNFSISGNVAQINGGGCAYGSYYNCSIVSNRAGALGGGGYQSGSYYNCAFIGNWASEAGGLYQAGDSYNCTVVGNTALLRGGGVVRLSGTLYNSLVYYNTAQFEENYSGVIWQYGCTYPLPATPNNTITNEPLIMSVSNPQLLPSTPCYNAGLNQGFMASMSDLAGASRILFSTVDIGAYEYAGSSSLTGSLSVAIEAVSTQVVVDAACEFAGQLEGNFQGLVWNFSDGSTLTNQCLAEHAWSSPGTYAVTLTASNQDGSATATVQVYVVAASACYVALSGSDVNSGATWTEAKQTIQAAVDAVAFGGTVWVSNGVYNTGARLAGGQATSNRVVVSRGGTVRSANGPEDTIIVGNGPGGVNAVRGVYLEAGASLIGFTVTNGAVATNVYGSIPGYNGGGGVFCEANSCVVSNCVVVDNDATVGAGVLGGTLYDCLVAGNVASNSMAANGFGGGAYYSRIDHSTLSNNYARFGGGGAYGAILTNSVIVNNSAVNGGGVYAGTLDSCQLVGNAAVTNGGGSYTSVLYRCTISNNVSTRYGGGAGFGVLSNCVVDGNVAVLQGGGGYKVLSLSDCTIRNNRAAEGGGLHAGGTAGYGATNCLIAGNNATNGDGGGVHYYALRSCIVVSNSATRYGGGQYDNTCVNSLLAYNTAGLGGGFYKPAGTAQKLSGCTIVANTALTTGGGAYWVTALTVTNCVIWGNTATGGTNWYGVSASNIDFSCTVPLPVGRNGNISNAPLFVDAANGDFHLASGSPCIDKGTNEAWMAAATDLDGTQRISGASVDMGAYEVQVMSEAMAVLGTNGVVIANNEAASSGKGSDFGACPWGASRTNAFAITNAGAVELTISGVTNSGAGADAFAVLNMPATVAVGAVSNILVVFSPSAAQAYTGVVAIANSSVTTPYNLCLAGAGSKKEQAITFPGISDKRSSETVGLSATADSGLPVSFVVESGPAWISVSTNLAFSGSGLVTIVASQSGNTNWNAAPSVSNTFNVALAQIVITNQPGRAVVEVGQAASLSVGYDGTAPCGYQWLKDGVILPGQTNNTLSIPVFRFADSGSYYVVITNSDGMAISAPASLSVSNAPLRTWGYNTFGSLGDGSAIPSNLPLTVSSNVVAMAGGDFHSLFVQADGTLWAMGYNDKGQLGNGSTGNAVWPICVASNVVAAAGGTSYSLFVKADGTLWAMGYNNKGQFGNGSMSDTNRPVAVASNVVAVAAGAYHSLFVKADGTLWAMGDNLTGQLGNGTNGAGTDSAQPVVVASNVVSVAAGAYHSLFMKFDGTLWAMGRNDNGQLGLGTVGDTNRPVQVTSNVMAVAAGALHSLFVETDGTLRAMGVNSHGQLGVGTNSDTNQPVVVASNVVTMAAGYQHSLFVQADGSMWAMGANNSGQLGDGTNTETNRPVLVNHGGLEAVTLARQPLAYHSLAIAADLMPGMLILGLNGSAVASGASASFLAGTKFQSVLLGASVTNFFSITNNGVVPTVISGYATTGADAACFVVAGLPAMLPVGSVSNFMVVYTPSTVGVQAATAVISNNSSTAAYAVNLAGSCCQLSDDMGPYAGGHTITITNGDFGTITNIWVGSVSAAFSTSGVGIVIITIPAIGSGGQKDIVIQTSDAGDRTFAGAYTVCIPATQIPVGAVVYDASSLWSNAPLSWRVVDTNYGGVSGAVTLSATNSICNMALLSAGWGNQWQNASLRDWLNSSNFYGTLSPSFSGIVMRTYVPWACASAGVVTGVSTDFVFIASRTELGGVSLTGDGSVMAWFSDSGTAATRRGAVNTGNAAYWTRTGERVMFGPSWYDMAADLVSVPDGSISYGSWTSDAYPIIPVLNIKGGAQFAPQTNGAYRFAYPMVQTLTFPNPGAQLVSNAVTLSATASSGLPVAFAVVSGPGSIASGSNLTFTGIGSVQVVATQAGSPYWDAVSETNTLVVSKMDQAISFPPMGSQLITNHVGLVATAGSGLTVSFAVGSGAASITNGTNLMFTGAGSVTIVAFQAGDTNWNAATPVTNAFTVSKLMASVILTNQSQTYNGITCTVTTITQPAGLPVDVTYNGSFTPPTGVGTYVVTGVVNDLLYQGSATGLLSVVAKPLTVTNAVAQDKVYDGTDVAQIVGATLVGKVGSDDVTLANATTGTFSQANIGSNLVVTTAPMTITGTGIGNYTLVQPTLVARISVKGLTVTNAVAQDKAYDGTTLAQIGGATLVGVVGGEDVTLANATTGTFAQADAGVAISVATLPMTIAGTHTANYSLIQPTLYATITKADQVLSNYLPADGSQFLLGASTTVSAQASSGLSVTFSNMTPVICSLSGTSVTFTNSGLAMVQVQQAGDSNWNAAVPVTHGWRVGGLITNLSRNVANIGGGVQILVQGIWLGNGTDITNVSLAGVPAVIVTQQVHEVTVLASAATGAITGDVTVDSGTGTRLVMSNGFTYLDFEAPVMYDPVAIATTNLTARWNVPAAAQSLKFDVGSDTNFTSYLAGYEKLEVALASQYPVSGLTAGQWVALRVFSWDTNGFSLPSRTVWVVASTNTPYETHPPLGGPVTQGAIMEMPLSNMFFGVNLIYSAESSDTNVMGVSVVGGVLRLEPRLPGQAVMTVRATNPVTGYIASYSFTVTVQGAPALLSNVFRPHELWNPRFEQLVTVRNTSLGNATGIRVLFTNLMAGITVENQTGVSWDGRPMIEQQFNFAAGTTQVLSIVYLCQGAYRADAYPPQVEIQYILPSWQLPLPGEGTVVSGWGMSDGSGRFILEFDSIVGALYAVEYTDNMSGPWVQVPVRLRAGANRTQWIDSGSPATLPLTLPGTRFYRVKQLAE